MDTHTRETAQREPAALDELRDDPQSRKRFLKMVGGAGAAGALAASDRRVRRRRRRRERSTTSTTDTMASKRLGVEGRPRDRQLRADARVPRGRLLRAGDRLGRGQGQEDRRAGEVDRRERAGARRGAQGDRRAARRQARQEAEDQLRRRARRRRRRSSRPPPRSRTSAPPPTSARPGNIKNKEILAAALSIHSVEARHAAALNHAHRQDDRPRRRVREAGVDGRGAEDRQALHRVEATSTRKETQNVQSEARRA